MALDAADTLPGVATKKLPRREAEAFQRVFCAWLRDEHGDNQTKAAAALGITQSHVSALKGGVRGVGLSTLIKLREPMGKTLDELLDLPPVKSAGQPAIVAVSPEQMRAILREELTTSGREPPLLPPGPDSGPDVAPRRPRRS